VTGDRLLVTTADGKTTRTYHLILQAGALAGKLQLKYDSTTVNTTRKVQLHFKAGQRSPNATIYLYIPAGIRVTMANTSVNVIGRGEVLLKDLETQSIGRTGSLYSYSKLGTVVIKPAEDGGTAIVFSKIDLRPDNGIDLVVSIDNVKLSRAGKYFFRASYTTTQPEVLKSFGTGNEVTILTAVNTITDLERLTNNGATYKESPGSYSSVSLRWTAPADTRSIQILQSTDKGKSWKLSRATIDFKRMTASITGLLPGTLYDFKLSVKDGQAKGISNLAHFYSGKLDIKDFNVTGEPGEDNTQRINEAIDYLHQLGGGTLLFSSGVYSVRTIHLKSNVWLFVEKGATIKALKGGDAPESTWFSDKKYRSGLSPTDIGPYADPENWLTKQDVGHTFFRNCMFFGERLDNVRIIGNGLITGDGNLVTGDKVMNNAPDNRSDKMFVFKLCTNIEIGGLARPEDLWYDERKDEPYYIRKNGLKDYNTDNMLQIDRAGHFVLLATGTDYINVHNTYFAKHNTSNVRDIYDFMSCSNVNVTNIYSKVSSDDIVKPGSDCSLGFTRPAHRYKVRNIIGDTNCNLFQIGSETADDIMDVHVDNIYVLGANKAGFSISTNDGGHIKDIHLNCGHTGSLHSRSKMFRTFTPFFISISNRGRVLGADVAKYSFTEGTATRNELLVKNVNIGKVENIILNGIDVYEVYAGSSYGAKSQRWKAYDGSQRRATAIVAGYSLPHDSTVKGGLKFTLPDGRSKGQIKNIVFNDVNILVKGGNVLADTAADPPELGVGQYNVSNLKVQPSYGIWARHVANLVVKSSSFSYEKKDERYALFLDDISGAVISGVKMMKASAEIPGIKSRNSTNVHIKKTVY
jgi:polygalacturonase